MGDIDRIIRVGRNLFEQGKRALHEATAPEGQAPDHLERAAEELKDLDGPLVHRTTRIPPPSPVPQVPGVDTVSLTIARDARDLLLQRLLAAGRLSPERATTVARATDPTHIAEALITLTGIVTTPLKGAKTADVEVPGTKDIRVPKELLPLAEKILLKDPPEETFDDIKGQEEAVKELRALTIQIKDPASLQRYGLETIKGLLLTGPGGVGKTMSVKALANEVECPVLLVTASEIFAGIVGESEQNVRKIFEMARYIAKQHPSGKVILFFDEIDSIVPIRDADVHEVTQKVVNLFLNELDGVKSDASAIVIGATNRPDRVDGALLSRLDKRIDFVLPTPEVRELIIRADFEKRAKIAERPLLAGRIDWDEIAQRTLHWGGRDLKKIARGILKDKWWDANVEGKKDSKVTTADILDEIEKLTPSVITVLANQGLVREAQDLKLSHLRRKAEALAPKEGEAAPTQG